jgi:hypothetical protein
MQKHRKSKIGFNPFRTGRFQHLSLPQMYMQALLGPATVGVHLPSKQVILNTSSAMGNSIYL